MGFAYYKHLTITKSVSSNTFLVTIHSTFIYSVLHNSNNSFYEMLTEEGWLTILSLLKMRFSTFDWKRKIYFDRNKNLKEFTAKKCKNKHGM
jgi:hypothetical protein